MTGTDHRWLRTTVNAVRDLMAKRLGTQSLDADTERDIKVALEELEVMWEELEGQSQLLSRESERYAEFFDHAPDAYVITDKGGNVREANRAAIEILRASRGALIAKPLSGFIADDDRVGFLARMVGMMIDRAPAHSTWECRIQPAEGAHLQAIVSVRAIPLRKSGIGGLCWLIRPA